MRAYRSHGRNGILFYSSCLDQPFKTMKPSRSETTKQNKQGLSHSPRPEIRDNLDSREKLEQYKNGDGITHHEKAKHSK